MRIARRDGERKKESEKYKEKETDRETALWQWQYPVGFGANDSPSHENISDTSYLRPYSMKQSSFEIHRGALRHALKDPWSHCLDKALTLKHACGVCVVCNVRSRLRSPIGMFGFVFHCASASDFLFAGLKFYDM